MSQYSNQLHRIKSSSGMVAALDQSGGSTPSALKNYGVMPDAYQNDEEMFDAVHALRTRIITASAFTETRILGAILFEQTMRREIDGKPTATYLWEEKHIIPFLKVDKGLADIENGVQLMKPMPELDQLLTEAKAAHVFGTKMRSVIHELNESAINAVVAQQFTIGKQIVAAGLMPIIEPEISIQMDDKPAAEALLLKAILSELDQLADDQQIMLKLTLPDEPGLYQSLVDHPKVLKVVALSGGYPLAEAAKRLQENPGIIASFSRALTEPLQFDQTDAEFNAALDQAIDKIYQASLT